jgi:hypothetical protein
MKQDIIFFVFILLASPALSAPAAYPLVTTISTHVSNLPIELKAKRQDQTVTYTGSPVYSGTDTGIPSVTDSSFPSPTDTVPLFSTPTDSISLVPTSSWGGGTTIDNTGTLTFPGATQTLTFGSETLTLTFPPTPVLTFAAEADPVEEKAKRQLLSLTEEGGSRTIESLLPAFTSWDNGGPVFSLTFLDEPVRATATSEAQLINEVGGNLVEVIKRQVDTITWDGALPVTTYWGDQTITIGGETITFGDGPGGTEMTLTIDAARARVTTEP